MSNRMPLDHLVVGVPDLSAATDEFAERLGAIPRFGGRHEGLGTHNAILPLAESVYVELIAADPETPSILDRPRPFGLDSLRTTRLVTWAVRSHALEDDLEVARQRGYDPGSVLSLSREAPNGEMLRWKLSLRREAFGEGLVPFVIDWGETRHPSETVDGEEARCHLVRFEARHPDSRSISDALDALGVELGVATGSPAGLTAELRGPSGSITLC